MMRAALLLECVSLIAAMAFSSPVRADEAYLYVGNPNLRGLNGTIERYPLSGGTILFRSDLTIPGISFVGAASPLGGVGEVLFAAKTGAIEAFADGATVPAREILLPPGPHGQRWQITAMAVDRLGYLFVSVSATGRSAVLAYAPRVRGHARPLAIFGETAYVIDALVVDDHGEAFVMSTGRCSVFADVRSAPQLVRSFTSAGLGNVYGAALYGGLLYVAALNADRSFAVNVFPPSARGAVMPVRSVVMSNETFQTLGALAVAQGTLFVGLSAPFDALSLFRAGASGYGQAFAAIPFLSGPRGIAAGR